MPAYSSNHPAASLAQQFAQLCLPNASSPSVFAFLDRHPQATAVEVAAVCAVDQSNRWRSGQGVPVEHYLEKLPQLNTGTQHSLNLIVAEYRHLSETGMQPDVEDFLSRFPKIRQELAERLAVEFQAGPTAMMPAAGLESDSHPELNDGGPEPIQSNAPSAPPECIGKFRIQRILGDGGFGRVYLAFDEDLRRSVAIKVPHEYRIRSQDDVQAYFEEARILASLDHPAIVPVFDFGRTEDGRCYSVTKYIEGSDLSARNKRAPLAFAAAAELISVVAEALHYSHLHGVVHRDIKPANILIDTENCPYVTDFGLALKEEDWGKDSPSAGTPSYMSPEQVRGEGHLVDGRSDIFSLGVVLYELLCGRRPFGKVWKDRMATTEARPLRQIDDSIPAELERICQKAMFHRVCERYSTARDMAEDLRHALDYSPESVTGVPGFLTCRVMVTEQQAIWHLLQRR